MKEVSPFHRPVAIEITTCLVRRKKRAQARLDRNHKLQILNSQRPHGSALPFQFVECVSSSNRNSWAHQKSQNQKTIPTKIPYELIWSTRNVQPDFYVPGLWGFTILGHTCTQEVNMAVLFGR